MKLYRAETGRCVDWQSETIHSIETLEHLYQIIESITGIPPESQILMTSYGNIVRKETVKEVVEATGQREYIVFCYDRDCLSAQPDQISSLLDSEIPTLEPEIPPFDGAASLQLVLQSLKKRTINDNCNAYVELFVKFDSYSRSLIEAATAHTSLAEETVEEQKLQSMALSVALSNLKAHKNTGSRNATFFIEKARKELTRQSSLMNSLNNDLEILKHTSIHRSILDMLEPGHQNKLKLLDFIDITHVDTIRADTKVLCKELEQEMGELQRAIKDLVAFERHVQEHIAANSNLQELDANLSDIKVLLSSAQECRDIMRKGLPKIYETISKLTEKPISALFENLSLSPSISTASGYTPSIIRRESAPSSSNQKISSSVAKKKFESFNHLADYQLKDPLLKLAKCEGKIRQNVDELFESKRKSIRHFLENMNVISGIQDHIAKLELQSRVALERLDEFKKKYGKKDLESIRQVSFAYGALLIEMVRRKEYAKILKKNSNLIADVLAEYRAEEEKRREHFRRAVTKSLPFKLTGMDKASPQSEITLNGANEYDKTVLDKQDITEFISLLGTVYYQPSHTSMSRRPSFLSSSSSSSSNATSRRSSAPSPVNASSSSKLNIGGGRKSVEENLLAILNGMYKQMTDMRLDFLKSIENNFFNVNKIYIDPSRIKEIVEKDENQESSLATTKGSPKSIGITAKSSNDETIPPPSRPQIKAAPPPSSSPKTNSTTSSTFSVVEDDKKLVQTTIAENNELKAKLEFVNEANASLEENNLKQEEDIRQLRETLKNLENEKEEFETQIQNLDQLVDNERHTFEQNRQSFLNELKNKDKSADFRIQSAEEDSQSKINDLQYELEEEKRMKKNLEIEHASELNTLHTEHASEIEKLNTLLQEEKQRTQDLQNEKWELNHRMDQLVEDMASVKYKLETERVEYEDQLSRLQTEIEDKEKGTDEIKLLQQQTRSMVKRAQDDWESKNEELKRIKSEQEIVDVAVRDLLYRFRMDEHKSRELDLKTDIRVFKDNLEAFTQRYDELQYISLNFEAVTQELTEVSEANKNLNEKQDEWRTIASHMAEKLEEVRKSVIYEVTQKLQLPMDEGELNILSRNLTPSDDDTAIWNQVLQLSSSINTQKFVLRILEHSKHNYEHALQYKTQYKNIKEKYNKLCVTYCEKIAFRNFKVGDVALFLPTRNSTGKPWAAFNINAPHYFLRGTDSTVAQTQSREWIVARIVSITEHITDENDPDSNPYGLSHGLTYYDLDVESWRNSKHPHKSKKRMISLQDNGLASLGSPSVSAVATPTPKRPLFNASSSSSNIVHSYVNK